MPRWPHRTDDKLIDIHRIGGRNRLQNVKASASSSRQVLRGSSLMMAIGIAEGEEGGRQPGVKSARRSQPHPRRDEHVETTSSRTLDQGFASAWLECRVSHQSSWPFPRPFPRPCPLPLLCSCEAAT